MVIGLTHGNLHSRNYFSDNGTGKTLVANILAFSRFAKITEAEYPQGALYIRGNDYRYDSDGKVGFLEEGNTNGILSGWPDPKT